MFVLLLYPAVKEKLTADPDSEIATTSLRVSLLCPVNMLPAPHEFKALLRGSVMPKHVAPLFTFLFPLILLCMWLDMPSHITYVCEHEPPVLLSSGPSPVLLYGFVVFVTFVCHLYFLRGLTTYVLTAQLGKMRLMIPCRALTCSHLQCFDATLYIQMNEKKPTWVCPVCDKKAPYEHLIIDG